LSAGKRGPSYRQYAL